MQYLTSLAINKGEKSYKRVFLDIEGYRKGREDALKELSHKMMKKASITGKPVRFEPMNPYERRIVHEELSKFDNVRTYSEGNEPSRYVVVTVKTEKRL